MEIEMGCRKEIIDSYSNDSEEWQEAQTKYGKLRGGLGTKIGLIIGIDGLRVKLAKWGEEGESMVSLKELKQRGWAKHSTNFGRRSTCGKEIVDFDR